VWAIFPKLLQYQIFIFLERRKTQETLWVAYNALEEEDEEGFDIPTFECLWSALGAQNK
jgi:hypothetical protein